VKPTQDTIIRILPGIALLGAITLRYLWFPPHGGRSSQWVVFGAILIFVLVAVGRRLLHRSKRLPPPQPLSPSEIGYCIIVTIVGCMLSTVGASHGESWLMGLGGVFIVVAIAVRMWPRRPDAPIVPTRDMVLRVAVLVPLVVCLMSFLAIPAMKAVVANVMPTQPRVVSHDPVQKASPPHS
jgi:hypothetical protein